MKNIYFNTTGDNELIKKIVAYCKIEEIMVHSSITNKIDRNTKKLGCLEYSVTGGYLDWWSEKEKENIPTISSLKEFVNLIPLPVKKLYVGASNYLVDKITSKGFSVGCEVITWEAYDKIGKLRPKA